MMPREPEEKENNEPNIPPPETAEGEARAYIPAEETTLEEELAEARKKAEEYLANWQRAQADFINYKRRTEQERLDFNSFANANLLCSILPVLDDFERALKAVPEEYANNDWVEGMRLVEKKLRTILEGHGVKSITCVGEPFDPNLHEAIRQAKGKEGIITEEYLKGYMLKDKLLRASKVAVGKGEAPTKKTHPKEKSEEIKEEEQNG